MRDLLRVDKWTAIECHTEEEKQLLERLSHIVSGKPTFYWAVAGKPELNVLFIPRDQCFYPVSILFTVSFKVYSAKEYLSKTVDKYLLNLT